MTLLFYTHPVALLHDAGPGHPEAPVRLHAILRAVEAAVIPGLERREAPLATLEQIHRVHPERYTSRMLAAVPTSGYVRVDADTVLNPHSGEAALRASGAACAAVVVVVPALIGSPGGGGKVGGDVRLPLSRAAAGAGRDPSVRGARAG